MSLSKRDRQVLDALCAGKTVAEVGDVLERRKRDKNGSTTLTSKSVYQIFSDIKKKLKARTRIHAIAIYLNQNKL